MHPHNTMIITCTSADTEMRSVPCDLIISTKETHTSLSWSTSFVRLCVGGGMYFMRSRNHEWITGLTSQIGRLDWIIWRSMMMFATFRHFWKLMRSSTKSDSSAIISKHDRNRRNGGTHWYCDDRNNCVKVTLSYCDIIDPSALRNFFFHTPSNELSSKSWMAKELHTPVCIAAAAKSSPTLCDSHIQSIRSLSVSRFPDLEESIAAVTHLERVEKWFISTL